jgi:hypothetical protein
VFSLAGFLYFGLGCVSGPLADRWGSRRLAIIGMHRASRPPARREASPRSMPLTGLADYFGGRHISGIIDILYTSVAIGTLIGPSAPALHSMPGTATCRRLSSAHVPISSPPPSCPRMARAPDRSPT